MTRNKVLTEAIEKCLKELYKYATPKIFWEDFIKENKEYKDGPKPYEFYYLPKEIMNDITNSYIYAYKLDEQQELLNIIEVLKSYCKNPVIDKYIEGINGSPGYRGYDHPDNLQLSIYRQSRDMFPNGDWGQFEEISKMSQDKFFEFLDMAGKFYKWNGELNSFNMSIYLGASPNSNKEAVIKNWKKYRNKDIEIDEEQIKKDYYGED